MPDSRWYGAPALRDKRQSKSAHRRPPGV